MPVIRIESVDDPRLAMYRDLKSPLSKRRGERFVVEGQLLAERLLSSGLGMQSVLVEERLADEWAALVPAETSLLVIAGALVRDLIGFRFHRGVLACGIRPPNGDLRQLLPADGDLATWVVCAGVQDPENLGGIMRSGAAFGIQAVLLGDVCADPFSRRVARTSMGANFRLPLVESEDLASDLKIMHDEYGVQLVATVLADDAEALERVNPAGRTALLFGSEGFGLAPHWLALCDRRVTIPMRPGVDSLNVNVAAGIFLYHWFRDRQTCGAEPPLRAPS
jgi:tRNA G18 (ribose-2'-O)-methylase SpoU